MRCGCDVHPALSLLLRVVIIITLRALLPLIGLLCLLALLHLLPPRLSPFRHRAGFLPVALPFQPPLYLSLPPLYSPVIFTYLYLSNYLFIASCLAPADSALRPCVKYLSFFSSTGFSFPSFLIFLALTPFIFLSPFPAPWHPAMLPQFPSISPSLHKLPRSYFSYL